MVVVPALPLNKQMIQLRMCLSLEIQHVLLQKFHVGPDDTIPLKDVLDRLETNARAQTNEALHRHELSCKQMSGETFNDFYVRIKNAAEADEICKENCKNCEETQLNQVMYVTMSLCNISLPLHPAHWMK